MIIYLTNIAAGLFLCNCIPHLAAGLQGQQFPTSFAKPRGIGNSSALINFLWGFFNLLAGLSLLVYAPVVVGVNLGFTLFVLAALIMGAYLSRHFASVKERNS
jgi:hypothetical protein